PHHRLANRTPEDCLHLWGESVSRDHLVACRSAAKTKRRNHARGAAFELAAGEKIETVRGLKAEGGSGEPGEERISGEYESRNSNSHECHSRHDGAGVDVRPDVGAEAISHDGEVLGRCPAADHRRYSGFLEDRGREA